MGFVAAHTAQANQIRGLLAEFGLVIPMGIGAIERSTVKTRRASACKRLRELAH